LVVFSFSQIDDGHELGFSHLKKAWTDVWWWVKDGFQMKTTVNVLITVTMFELDFSFDSNSGNPSSFQPFLLAQVSSRLNQYARRWQVSAVIYKRSIVMGKKRDRPPPWKKKALTKSQRRCPKCRKWMVDECVYCTKRQPGSQPQVHMLIHFQ
jgi:hypothetical protein